MPNTLKIEHRDPVTLKGHFHPALKTIPELAETSEEFLGIARGVERVGGIVDPLKVDEQGRILDDHSRILLRCALRWQFKTVPVQVMVDANVPMLVIHGLAHRRHLSKSAIAYLAVPLLEEAFSLARAKMLKIIEVSGVSSGDSLPKTVEELATDMGLGRNLLFEARKVHEAFRDKKEYTFQITGGPEDGSTRECTLRDYYEPKLLQAFVGGEHEQNRPIGLGGIMAGIASVREGNKDKFSPKKNSQLDLFTKATDNGITRWVAWHTFDEAERVSHLRNVQSRLKMLHADDLEALQDYYTALLAEVTKVAKSTKVNS